MEWLQKTKLLFTSVHFTRFRNPAIKLIPLSKIIRFKIYLKNFARRKIKNISRIFFKLSWSKTNYLGRRKQFTLHHRWITLIAQWKLEFLSRRIIIQVMKKACKIQCLTVQKKILCQVQKQKPFQFGSKSKIVLFFSSLS